MESQKEGQEDWTIHRRLSQRHPANGQSRQLLPVFIINALCVVILFREREYSLILLSPHREKSLQTTLENSRIFNQTLSCSQKRENTAF